MIPPPTSVRIKRLLRPIVWYGRRLLPDPPQTATSPSGVRLCVDAYVPLNAREALIRGWLIDVMGMVERVELVSGPVRSAFPQPLLRTRRADLDELCRQLGVQGNLDCGFMALVSGPEGWLRGDGAMLEATLIDGTRLQAACPCAGHGARAATRVLDDALRYEPRVDPGHVDKVVVPVIDQLFRPRTRTSQETTRTRIGPVVRQPDLSVLLLYPTDRRDLLECRIAGLTRGRSRNRIESLLVLPARLLSSGLQATLRDLTDLYRLPLTVVAVADAAELANLSVAGARHGRGRWLCVLGGGLIPDVEALDTMLELAASRDDPGMVGPRLIFEDLSLQHAGIGFAHDHLVPGTPRVAHHLRGLPRRLAQTQETRAVATVAGDCFLMEKETFESLASPCRRYLTPGLDEVELGLRCLEEGLQNWYLADVELYNLAELGQPPATVPVNSWFERADELRLAREWHAQQQPWLEPLDGTPPHATERRTDPGAGAAAMSLAEGRHDGGSPAGPPVTVVIPTLNGGAEIRRVLPAVLTQATDSELEVLVIDSGSTDGTLEFLDSQPVRLLRVSRSEFNHGLTRNLGIREARGEIVVLLSQDALPADDQWLQSLIACYDDERIAGAYSRQIARDDANPFIRDRLERWAATQTARRVQKLEDLESLDTLSPRERLERVAFDNVSSSVRRTVALELPFREIPFGEDLDWGHRVVRAGHHIVFEPRSSVIHSHNDSIWREFKRVYLDHQNLHRVLGLHAVPRGRDVAIGGWRYSKYLLDVCSRAPLDGSTRRFRWTSRAVPFGFTQVLAQFLGARSTTWKTTRLGRRIDRWLARGV